MYAQVIDEEGAGVAVGAGLDSDISASRPSPLVLSNGLVGKSDFGHCNIKYSDNIYLKVKYLFGS